MDVASLRNPYDYRNPVRSAAVFAGRSAEMATISYELDQAGVDQPSVCLVLHGVRAAGKTSLLNATEWLARERGLLTVRVELIEGDGEPNTFFRKVYEELVTAVVQEADVSFDVPAVRRAMAGVGEPDGATSLEFPEAVALAGPDGRLPEAALRNDLTQFVGLLGRPIAFLIDEAQLAARDGRVLSVLRHLTSRVDGLLLVLAGTPELLSRITQVHSPILRQFREIEVLGFVEMKDVYNCIARPLRTIGVHAHDLRDVADALQDLTDGSPYEIQLYCYEVFARWQRGEAKGMALSPDILEGIRSRMESGRNVLDRPLIRAVRAMDERKLTAFNVLTSALGRGTADDTWFAHCVAEPPKLTREEYDGYYASLIADGILTAEGPVRFAVETELFDEVYVRLWTARVIGKVSRSLLIRRSTVRAIFAHQLLELMRGLSDGTSLQFLPTCCLNMRQSEVDEMVQALEMLPSGGPDTVKRISYLHRAVLQAGEPAAIDLTTVACSFRDHRAERWFFAPGTNTDVSGVDLTSSSFFRAAADRIADLGGELIVERVRVPLHTWPATSWFQEATGSLRTELAANHSNAAYWAHKVSEIPTACRHFQAAYELRPNWEFANNLAHLALLGHDTAMALAWSERALALLHTADNPWAVALIHYNVAMTQLLAGHPERGAEHLVYASEALTSLPSVTDIMRYTLNQVEALDPITFRVEDQVSLRQAVAQAREMLSETGGAEGTGQWGADSVSVLQFPAIRTANVQAEPVLEHVPVVLAVATEWFSAHGGLSTFNRELCRALGQAGARVFCVVLTATAEEQALAEAVSVTLLPAPARPGASDDLRLASRPELPAGAVPDLIIGHGRITGPAAQKLADETFPNARRLHFVHMAPDEIEWYKPGRDTQAGLRAEERTAVERALGTTADRVIAVGPRLYELFQADFPGTEILRLDPGFDAPGEQAPRTPPGGAPVRVLLFGRTEDARLKGVDLAAAACGQVAEWRHDEGLSDIRLTVRGALPSAVDKDHQQITGWADSPRLKVLVRPYSSETERLEHDLLGASLVIIPSRSEGFGLVGAEAIAMGVPILVSSSSGLAQLLRLKLGHESAARFVVDSTGSDDEDAARWARAIDTKLRDRDHAFRQAAELSADLRESVTWKQAAATILGEVANARQQS